MNEHPKNIYIAQDRKPEFTLPKILGILLALGIIWGVIFILLSVFPESKTFFLEISIILSGLIIAALLGENFLRSRQSHRLQLIYKLQISTQKQKIRLERLKAKGFIQFTSLKAILIHQGCFVTLELRSAKSNKLVGTLTNKDDRWKQNDILHIAEQLQQLNISLEEKTLQAGEVVGSKITFEHKLLNNYIILLFVVLAAFLTFAVTSGVLLESPLGSVLSMGIIYGVMTYPQKQFIITPTHLIVKSRWLPLYRHQLALDNIKSIKAITAYARRDVQEYLQIDLIKKRQNKNRMTLKFYSVLGREHIRQVVYLVKERMQNLPKNRSLEETRVDGSLD